MTRHRVLFYTAIVALCVGAAFLLAFAYKNNFSKNSTAPAPVPEPAPEAIAEPGEDPGLVTRLTGVVTGVSGNSFTFRIEATGGEELDAALRERTVTVTDTTTITVVTNPDPEEARRKMEIFEEEMRKYSEAVKTLGDNEEEIQKLTLPVMPTTTLTRSSATPADFAIGQTVSVTAWENAGDPQQVSAVSVEILPGPGISSSES